MVSVKFPVAAPADVETLSVVVAVGVTGLEIEHVTPVGQPLTVRFTPPVNPFRAVTATLDGALPPGMSVNEDGLAEIEKSGLVDRFAYASTSATRLH
jgi:hypothetical protein